MRGFSLVAAVVQRCVCHASSSSAFGCRRGGYCPSRGPGVIYSRVVQHIHAELRNADSRRTNGPMYRQRALTSVLLIARL
jgi:hypothetical protein